MRLSHEAHLSTIGCTPQAHPWFPGADAYPGRRGRDSSPAREGARTSQRLSNPASEPLTPVVARLRSPAQFKTVLAHRRSVSGKFFQVFAKPNGISMARLGLVAGKKQAPHAVDRNYAKRLVREVFRANGAAFAGLDLVVRLRQVISRREGPEARREIATLLTQATQCLTCSSA